MRLGAKALRRLLHYEPGTGVFTWLVRASGSVRVGAVAGTLRNGYRVISIRWRNYYAHRLAWLYMTGAWPQDQIDHRNGQKSDNAWSNLREADHSLNLQNLRKARSDNMSGLLGVSPYRGKFRSEIIVGGKRAYLGTYRTPEAAHAAYLKAKRELHPGCTI